MKLAIFSNKGYWVDHFNKVKIPCEHQFFDSKLNKETVCHTSASSCHKLILLLFLINFAMVAKGYDAVCIFVNDIICSETLTILKEGGTKLILLRCAGFNNVDLEAAKKCGITCLRVPRYSPNAVAEYAAALMMTLNRKIHKAYNRVREGNFSLESLEGFDFFGKTVGVFGTGKIGELLCNILVGFGCKIIAYDVVENEACKKIGVKYMSQEEVFRQSDIISLHTPLLKDTKHMINDKTISLMKDGVMLINTSRGALIDTKAVINGLKSKKIGYLGIDVYENEGGLYFDDNSGQIMMDDTLARLMTFPNVLITGHQAWFTQQALDAICQVTMKNLNDFKNGTIDKGNLVEYEPSGCAAK
ncbi:D-lactate dehydrogenase [Cavenderia fasciculata]|uniref:D-lactate dehydrogenase n=1 Tax=Cavenderia fasciculata TaxID=261658 RepID=F4PGC9_CACFS|nr:D-lactate dehydrogenase [Cavenderia fasciculata]EGG24763.1 D-lactate dehydrogenase [Cavenderia fasciculata]|eukprot:XP_004362614.1 D-lactate dehydrogenase [Cavenderia fasciculata]